jgi:hypothetical protein
MGERRPLTDGLKTKTEPPRALEEAFVYADKPAKPNNSPELVTVKTTSHISRVPFTTRLRSDLAEAVKRASLERQLQKVEPNTVQEILESALEPWLRANGYVA